MSPRTDGCQGRPSLIAVGPLRELWSLRHATELPGIAQAGGTLHLISFLLLLSMQGLFVLLIPVLFMCCLSLMYYKLREKLHGRWCNGLARREGREGARLFPLGRCL